MNMSYHLNLFRLARAVVPSKKALAARLDRLLDLEDAVAGKLHYQRNGHAEQKGTSFYSVFVTYKLNLKNHELFV